MKGVFSSLLEVPLALALRSSIATVGRTAVPPLLLQRTFATAASRAAEGANWTGTVVALKVGKIKESTIESTFKSIGETKALQFWKLPNGSRGNFCFIQYKNKDHAEQAIQKLNGTVLEGNTIKVAKSRFDGELVQKSHEFGQTEAPPGTSGKDVYIAFGANTTKEDTRNHLQAKGIDVSQVKFKLYNAYRGFGVVGFDATSAAAEAIRKLDKTQLMGESFRATLSTAK
eukprot:Filipodium_phascolosomae@DN2440_c0_g1_i1.p1